jgi:hypothetical protein
MLRFASAVSLAVAALSAGNARADVRSFTHTYEYSTVPEGRTAVELWHTQGRDTWDKSSPQYFEQIIELEHGLTDHWDAAFYTVFAQLAGDTMTPSVPYGLDSVRLETRYRFADRGEWPVDTLVYLELAKDFGRSIYEIEGKVILARDFDKLTLAANAITEIAVGNDTAETELELGWAAGATYWAHPKVRIGAETWGQYEEEELYLSAGPALNLSLSSNFWLTTTAGFGITDEAPAFEARAIVGIEL